jgi:hypothetical protein
MLCNELFLYSTFVALRAAAVRVALPALPFFWAFFCPRSQLRSQLYSRAVFAARSLSADARAVSFGSQLGSVRPPCAGLRACFCASRGDGALRELLFG